jgi:hypothetical protein
MGDINPHSLDATGNQKLFVEIFEMVQTILNMIIFVNLVIAILSDTFMRLANQKLGLFYDGVIEVIHAYKYQKYYGALIAAVPPFNLFVLPFLPFFMFVKHKKRLSCLNNSLVSLSFLPFACFGAIIFAVGNFLFTPVAYCRAIFQKAKSLKQFKQNCSNFAYFLLLGLPMMYLTHVADFIYFFKHIYAFRMDYLRSKKIDGISLEAFNTLEAVIKREMKHLSENPNDPLYFKTE